MSGSKGPAEAGQLIFLAGGDRALFERAQPALDVMGKAAYFLGPARGLLIPYSLYPNLIRRGARAGRHGRGRVLSGLGAAPTPAALAFWGCVRACVCLMPWICQRAVPHPSRGQMPSPCAVPLQGYARADHAGCRVSWGMRK